MTRRVRSRMSAAAGARVLFALAGVLWGRGVSGEIELPDPSWRAVDVAAGRNPALALASGGDVLVMGSHGDAPMTIWLARAASAGGPFVDRDLEEGYLYAPGDLALANDGTAHVAWHDHDTENAAHAVVAVTGEITINDVETPGSHDGWEVALCFDADGVLHMSAVDPLALSGVVGLEHNVFDGAMWTPDVVPGSGTFNQGFGTSIACDDAGGVHIAYCEATEFFGAGTLGYALERDGAWSLEPVVTGDGAGRFPSLALDSAGRPHVAWLDVDIVTKTRAEIRYAVRDEDGWDIEPVGSLDAVDIGLAGARKSVSLVLDDDGSPHIAFADTRVLRWAHRGETGWEIATIANATDDTTLGGLVEMALDGDGEPVFAFSSRVASDDPGTVHLASRRPDGHRPFHRGDIDASGALEITDPVFLLENLFRGGPAPPCLEAADANNDASSDISDALFVLNFLFRGGPAPPAPGPATSPCDVDPDPPGSSADLGCERYDGCGV